jgi:hypothetical protein
MFSLLGLFNYITLPVQVLLCLLYAILDLLLWKHKNKIKNRNTFKIIWLKPNISISLYTCTSSLVPCIIIIGLHRILYFRESLA